MIATEREAQLIEAIAQLPRVPLASVRPTPLEPLPRLSAHLGGPPLYIKRDDLTGLAMGGNKTRMFEFALADALTREPIRSSPGRPCRATTVGSCRLPAPSST